MRLQIVRIGLLCAVAFAATCDLAFTDAAFANEKSKLDCENATSTYELNACADREFEAADAELNKVYAEALKAIPDMAGEPPYDAKAWQAALRASQRAWIAYRDAECDAHVPMFWTGGSGATAEIVGCKTTMTKARTKEIQEHYMEH